MGIVFGILGAWRPEFVIEFERIDRLMRDENN